MFKFIDAINIYKKITFRKSFLKYIFIIAFLKQCSDFFFFFTVINGLRPRGHAICHKKIVQDFPFNFQRRQPLVWKYLTFSYEMRQNRFGFENKIASQSFVCAKVAWHTRTHLWNYASSFDVLISYSNNYGRNLGAESRSMLQFFFSSCNTGTEVPLKENFAS